ncbi:MAG: UDP-N-acetylglucosamine transferase subunit [Phylliscum demangeonii]|nr:MAG: UDP-N-acetylglucosamine transferase subunit [Phylliscum demangeonii]
MAGMFAIGLVVSLLILLRLLYILPSVHPTRPLTRRRHDPTRLLVVLGSGGHTAEMLAILRHLDPTSYTHRTYVISEGDDFSAVRAEAFEASLKPLTKPRVDDDDKSSSVNNDNDNDNENPLARTSLHAHPTALPSVDYEICVVPRARKIHQPLRTTPVSALRCLAHCLRVLRGPNPGPATRYPDLIVTNGPGTAVCVVWASLWLRFWGLARTRGRMRTIYIESWARVRRLSLSGRILLYCVDRMLVQWPGLHGVGGRAEYLGVLV